MDINKYRVALKNLSQGVNAAEGYYVKSSNFEVGVLDGVIDTYEVSSSEGICVRADCGNMGYAFTSASEDDPQRLLELAMQNAKSVQSEDEQVLFPGATEYVKVDALSEKLLGTTAEQKIAAVYKLEKSALAQEGISRLQNCVIGTGISSSALFNSLGLNLSQSQGYAIAYVSAVANKNGEQKNGSAYDAKRTLDELDIDKVVREAAQDVLGQFGAGPVSSGNYKVLFKNTAASDLLEVFSSLFDADNAQKGLSLLAGREGDTISSAQCTIIDDPRVDGSLNQSAFDAEGVPTRYKELVSRGELLTLMHNLKTAKKGGTQTTGNASKGGSIAGSIGIAPTNMFFAPSQKSRDALLARMGNGLYITDLSGLHAGANAVSGTFSLLSRGFVVEDGKIGRPVDQITLAGNFLDLLRAIEDTGNDLRFGLGRTGAPCVLVSSLMVSGK